MDALDAAAKQVLESVGEPNEIEIFNGKKWVVIEFDDRFSKQEIDSVEEIDEDHPDFIEKVLKPAMKAASENAQEEIVLKR